MRDINQKIKKYENKKKKNRREILFCLEKQYFLGNFKANEAPLFEMNAPITCVR